MNQSFVWIPDDVLQAALLHDQVESVLGWFCFFYKYESQQAKAALAGATRKFQFTHIS